METAGEWLEKALLDLCKKTQGLSLDGDLISGLVSYCDLAPPLDAKEYLDTYGVEEHHVNRLRGCTSEEMFQAKKGLSKMTISYSAERCSKRFRYLYMTRMFRILIEDVSGMLSLLLMLRLPVLCCRVTIWYGRDEKMFVHGVFSSYV
ncbi:activating signal cointegrator 1 [Tanacetum coccineum]